MRLRERLNRLEAAIDQKAREFSHPTQDTLPFDDMPLACRTALEEALSDFPDKAWRIGRIWSFLKVARERQEAATGGGSGVDAG